MNATVKQKKMLSDCPLTALQALPSQLDKVSGLRKNILTPQIPEVYVPLVELGRHRVFHSVQRGQAPQGISLLFQAYML